MKYISELEAGSRISGVYLCKYKQNATTKTGKPYDNVILMDRTGAVNAKVWEPDSPGIESFDALDYISIMGEVSSYNGALQVSIRRARIADAGEYNPADYLPTTQKNVEQMYGEMQSYIDSIQNRHLKAVLDAFFGNKTFAARFKKASAAKSIHHGFMGGLLEHTLSVTKLCDYYCTSYPFLKRDLLLTAAMLHDIGKLKELSDFPANDYTDEGQLLGHIVIGTDMIHSAIRSMPDFPKKLANELLHCIVAHHGKLEYGSPKLPALAEAMALSFADITDARMETVKEMFEASTRPENEWLGYSKVLETNLRQTGELPD